MPMIQRTHPNDTLIVKNIDVDCVYTTSDTVLKNQIVGYDDRGKPKTREVAIHEEWSHSNFFQVRHGGQAYTLRPGEERMMPRFLAEHYAKHLADHYIYRLAKKEDRKDMIKDPSVLKAILKMILLKVEQYFLPPEEQEVLRAQMNFADDEGAVVLSGDTKFANPPKEDKSLDQILAEKPKVADPVGDNDSAKPQENPIDKLSKKELQKALSDLEVDMTGQETKEELAALLKAF